MDMNHLTDIPFTLNVEQLLARNRIKPGTEYGKKFEALIEKVQRIGKPKAMYSVSFIDEKGEDFITINDTVFTSIVLRKNMDAIERVFPYLATCGTEVDEIKPNPGDTLESFWLHHLKTCLLESAMGYLIKHIDTTYKTGKLSSMNPGSGDECVWPIEQQADLFPLFVDVYSRIGVRLTEASVLVPQASLMGIFFQTEIDFESCQLCHRNQCPSRRAPFNKEMWDTTYSAPLINNSGYGNQSFRKRISQAQ